MPMDADGLPDPASCVRTPRGWQESVLRAYRCSQKKWLRRPTLQMPARDSVKLPPVTQCTDEGQLLVDRTPQSVRPAPAPERAALPIRGVELARCVDFPRDADQSSPASRAQDSARKPHANPGSRAAKRCATTLQVSLGTIRRTPPTVPRWLPLRRRSSHSNANVRLLFTVSWDSPSGTARNAS